VAEGCRVGDVAQRMFRRLAALSCLLLLLCGGCAPKAGLFPLPEIHGSITLFFTHLTLNPPQFTQEIIAILLVLDQLTRSLSQ